MAVGLAAWKLLFEASPIFLSGGVVEKTLPGAQVPILIAVEVINLTGPLSVFNVLTAATAAVSLGLELTGGLDNLFCHFQPSAGATVIDQQIASYPFANQQVAANAVIDQPKRVSFTMTCPARGTVSYWTKLAKMMVLVDVLTRHNQSGGTYTLITPSFVYVNCLMRSMRDTSSGQTKQVQNIWTLDFEKPLITLADAKTAEEKLSAMLGGLDDGTKIVGPPNLPGGPVLAGP